MKKSLLSIQLRAIVLVLCLFAGFSVKAQTDSVKWALNATTTITPAIVGNVTGANQSLSSWLSIANYTGTPIQQRIRINTTYTGQSAAGWPALITSELSDVFMDFPVSPAAGYKFHVNAITFDIIGGGTSNMKANVYISTDPTFANRTAILQSGILGQTTFTAVNYIRITGLDTIVNDGKTFYVRVYPWLNNNATASNSKYICIQNLVVKGTTELAGPALSSDATLSTLAVSTGTLSPSFAAGTVDYSVVLPYGTTAIPSITATVNEAHATKVITDASSIPGSGKVEVTAQDGTKKTYTIDYSIAAPSTDATLSALSVNTGTLSPAFAAGTIDYSVQLPYGTTTVPTITATVNEAHATALITQAPSVTGSGTVVVTAQDGSTSKTYTVTYSLAAPSTDATLQDLKIDGTTVAGFAAGTIAYNLTLPYGTSTVPAISATVNEAHATTLITQAPSVTGSGTVVVTAQDGSTTKTYTVNFSVAASPSTDATLKDLKVDGTTVTGFAAGTIFYNVVLPYGTSTVPAITATVNEANATTLITNASSVTGAGTVVVTAQDGTTKITYTVNFSVAAPSTDATLTDLQVTGRTLSPAFSAGTLTYSVVLPFGTIIGNLPVITYTTAPNATAVKTNATALPGASTIDVTAQDGTTKKTYTINFSVAAPSTDATLTDLQVTGNTLSPTFSAGTLTYSVILPFGTTIGNLPAVTYTAAPNATAAKIDAAALPGSTTIDVTAQDGTTKKTYTINFSVAAPSTDATLTDLQVTGNTLSPTFSAGTLTYSVILPFGTTIGNLPAVTYTAAPNANASKTNATSLPGATTIDVTAQDGTTKKTYTINFSVALSTDATLSDLKLDGTTITGFAANTISYSVVLPAGTTTIPTITATVNESHATTVITQATSLTGSGTVVVTAQDGSTKTYTITFSVNNSAPIAPVAIAATSIAKTSFAANWNASASATGYYLDVATDNAFTIKLTNYIDKNVSNVTTFTVTGLLAGTTYYYRVRASNTIGTSPNSNVITVISSGSSVTEAEVAPLKIWAKNTTVEIKSSAVISDVKVTTISGTLLTEKTINSTNASISTDNWSAGVYIFTVKTQNETIVKKISISK
jgi:hypothetical protein